jgi:hypothetical protein
VIAYLRRWANVPYLLWTIQMQRKYLAAIMKGTDDPFAHSLSMAGFARSRDEEARLLKLYPRPPSRADRVPPAPDSP